MATVRGWPFLTVAWFGLGQGLFAFALIYLLALGDHHLTERIPTHEHLTARGQTVRDHAHGFAQRHPHDPAAAAWTAPSHAAVVPATTVTMPALLWLNGLMSSDVTPVSPAWLWAPAILTALILSHQHVISPATPPPVAR